MLTYRFASVGLLVVCVAVVLCSSAPVRGTEEEYEVLPEVAYPCWSPDGAHIAFESDRESGNKNIWFVHPDGTGLQRITDDPGADFNPKWAPDSQSLYFLSNRTGNVRLWRRNLVTGQETKAIESALGDYAVSHSGSEIIVDTTRGHDWGLIVVSANTGTELRWLAVDGYVPAWSPDDTEATFFRKRNVWARSAIDRSNLRQLTHFTADERLMGTTLDWGPQSFIVFDVDGKIYRVRPDGTDLTCLFQDAGNWAESPCWSLDGLKIAFVLTQDAPEIHTINADGSALTQVTHTVATPTFHPDGGTYTSPQQVTITCATSGHTIRYTTDGSDPTESSTEYTTPVTISEATTLKAKAWKTDYFPSCTKIGEYIIE